MKSFQLFSFELHKLLSSKIFKHQFWIVCLFYLFYFLQIVIFGQSKILYQSRRKRLSTTMRTNHMLILNLSLADFLMGIYLLVLGIAGAVYAGRFCRHENVWKSGPTCKVMGAIVVISSETSVLTMVLLASVRLYGVIRVSLFVFIVLKNISCMIISFKGKNLLQSCKRAGLFRSDSELRLSNFLRLILGWIIKLCFRCFKKQPK